MLRLVDCIQQYICTPHTPLFPSAAPPPPTYSNCDINCYNSTFVLFNIIDISAISLACPRSALPFPRGPSSPPPFLEFDLCRFMFLSSAYVSLLICLNDAISLLLCFAPLLYEHYRLHKTCLFSSL